ncbi:MAG: hypothetical protein JST22_02765 [Bacteroidetes bacterium]|nr:hypothetical protein [Bacteroidota bacterium]
MQKCVLSLISCPGRRIRLTVICTVACVLAFAAGVVCAQQGGGGTGSGNTPAGPLVRPVQDSAGAAAIERVFNDLVRSIHDTSLPPRLEVTDGSNVTVAAYFPGERVVRVDARLYEVCRTFGTDADNALAVVLGHELVHCYRGFRAAREFGNGAYRDDLHRMASEKIVSEETEADLIGGFYCRMAGYDGTRVMPELLEKVYDAFNIPDTLQDYLPKSGRKTIALRVGNQLSRLLPIFDAANFLSLARRYAEVQRCYDHVLRWFPSREIYNNAGVASLLQVLPIIYSEDVGFIYPVELDADSRLRGTDVLNGQIERSTRSPTAKDSAHIVQLLDDAEHRFRGAQERDGTYAPALVNLATVYLLRREYQRAIDTAAAAMAADWGPMTHILGTIVQSIAYVRLGDPDKARRMLQALRESAQQYNLGAIVDADLAVVNKEDLHVPGGLGKPSPNETIGGFRGRDTSALTPPEFDDTLAGTPRARILSGRQSGYSMLRMQGDTSWIQFIWTGTEYDGATRLGIRIGSTADDVLGAYGDRPRLVNARQGVYFIYDYSKLIFLIGPGGKVLKWGVYAVG